MPSGQCVAVVERICNAFIYIRTDQHSKNTCINIVLFGTALFCSRTHTKITKGTIYTQISEIHSQCTQHTAHIVLYIIIENTPPHSKKIMALFYA